VTPVAASPPVDDPAAPVVEVWVDVVCPWAYLGLDRSAMLRDLGFEVRSRGYELHPEIPPEGAAVRSGGRLAATYERVAAECAEAGLPFRVPRRVPNSRRALEWTEAVAIVSPDLHEAVVRALFEARFGDDADLSDPATIRRIVGSTGVDTDVVAHAVDDGRAAARLVASIEEARDQGIVATPAWRFPNGFVVPGVQPREQLARWAGRLMTHAPGPPGGASGGR
jgi:predicted DsbA family dithiol-disulfide isomerase